MKKSNFGSEDPCGKQVDAEIVALEHYQALQRGGHPASAVALAKQFYDAAKTSREICRRQAGMEVQAVVQPGRNTTETVKNIRTEASRRSAAGDTVTAERLRLTADTIVDEAADEIIHRSKKEQFRRQLVTAGLCAAGALVLTFAFYFS